MKSYIAILSLSLAFISCKPSVNKADLQHLNGFWEIKEVETADGKTIDYKINLSVDNFEINPELTVGTRKKGMPQLSGEYLTNGVVENFKVSDSAGIIKLNYETPYAKWSEEVVEINATDFKVKNDNEVIYHYKKYETINTQK